MTSVGAFVADIPDVTCEQLAKLYAWTQSKFKESQINMDADRSSYTLSALCLDGSTKTVRQWQSLLRTNLLNWGVELPKGQKNWLRGVSAEEYQSIMDQVAPPDVAAPNHPSSPTREQNDEASPKMQLALPMSGSAQACNADAPSARIEYGLRLPRNLLCSEGRRMVRSCGVAPPLLTSSGKTGKT